MKNKNQTGLKNFKPKINLNHNMYLDQGKESFVIHTCKFSCSTVYLYNASMLTHCLLC